MALTAIHSSSRLAYYRSSPTAGGLNCFVRKGLRKMWMSLYKFPSLMGSLLHLAPMMVYQEEFGTSELYSFGQWPDHFVCNPASRKHGHYLEWVVTILQKTMIAQNRRCGFQYFKYLDILGSWKYPKILCHCNPTGFHLTQISSVRL